MKKFLAALSLCAPFIALGPAMAADQMTASDDYMPSLITKTPLEGRKLAITIVRKTIGAIQPDADSKKRVRAIYQEDPVMLMRAAELVTQEFRTIAEANNYWRR